MRSFFRCELRKLKFDTHSLYQRSGEADRRAEAFRLGRRCAAEAEEDQRRQRQSVRQLRRRHSGALPPRHMVLITHSAQAYSAVDKVFDECKRVGDELSRIMRIWKAAAQAAKPATSTGTPTNEEQEKETGVNFTELNDKLVQESLAKTNVSPHLKEAFEGYLHVPPKGVPDTITLKGYQMLGINWLYLLYRKKHSCILADEMGACHIASLLLRCFE